MCIVLYSKTHFYNDDVTNLKERVVLSICVSSALFEINVTYIYRFYNMYNNNMPNANKMYLMTTEQKFRIFLF